jgi:hypothetical protein
MYNYDGEEMPLASASEMLAMGFLTAEDMEPWDSPIDAPDLQDGAYFSDADLKPALLAA